MIVVNMLLLVASVVLAIGIFCRLNKLSMREHKLLVILFNVGLIGAILSVGDHAWTGNIDLQDICVLIATSCWIAISYKAWEFEVPTWARK